MVNDVINLYNEINNTHLYTLEEISKLCGNTEKGPLISIQELKTLDNF